MLKRSVNRRLLFMLLCFLLVLPPPVHATGVYKVTTTTFDTSNTLFLQLIIWFIIIAALIALTLVMMFYRDKLRGRLLVRAGASWMTFWYSHIETGESIQVGEWLDDYRGDQRVITFKPTRPLLEDGSGLMDWLEAFLSEYGTVVFSEKGVIKVSCSDEIQPDKLLEQVGWVFYTLQMTSSARA
jgi:hypothetical protein